MDENNNHFIFGVNSSEIDEAIKKAEKLKTILSEIKDLLRNAVSIKNNSVIKFELQGNRYTFEELQEKIKKICEAYESKCELHIKVLE